MTGTAGAETSSHTRVTSGNGWEKPQAIKAEEDFSPHLSQGWQKGVNLPANFNPLVMTA